MTAVTVVGIISIALGFLAVLRAYWAFQHGKHRQATALGIAAFICLTVIPVICAVFFAA